MELICGLVKNILLLSDTHSCVEPDIIKHFADADEIWHGGDWGNMALSDILEKTGKTIRSVWGNVDGQDLRTRYPLHNRFTCEGIKVWITHIGGYPGKYNPKLIKDLYECIPDLFITGHSHILKVMRDKNLKGMLHMNPGAAGRHGFHIMRTMIKFELDAGKIQNVAVIELGKRTEGKELPEI